MEKQNVNWVAWIRTKTVRRKLTADSRQLGPIVALRALPMGKAVALASFADPETGEPDRKITIGSHPQADFVVSDPTGVSALHCTLRIDDDSIWVENHSKNGTQIARTYLRRGEVEVFAGQVLEIGEEAQILLCNEALERCPADIVATTMATFCEEAKRRYRKKTVISRMICVAYGTVKDWFSRRRWQQI